MILATQRYKNDGRLRKRLKYEEILAFRKPGADGGGIAAVITSPPYEGINDESRPFGGIKNSTANVSGSLGRNQAGRYTRET